MDMVNLAREQWAQASDRFHTDYQRLHSLRLFHCHGKNRIQWEHDSVHPYAVTCGNDRVPYSSALQRSMRRNPKQKLLSPRQKLSLSLILL